MIIDIIVIAVLLISAIIAFLRGLIREILTIAGVVGGMLAAYFGAPFLTPSMRGWLGVEENVEADKLFGVLPYDLLAEVLSYGAIFIVVVIILSIVSHFVAEGAKSMGLGAIDRTFGFIFGLLRGILILGLLNLPVYLYVDQETIEKFSEGSKSIFYINKTSAIVKSLIPASTTETMDSSMNSINESLGAQDKLDQIEFLKQQQERFTPPSSSPKNETGYDEELRNQMDQLFKEKTEDR
jgi:membrane protein required for colicin V production